jgi:hypothetical protein
MDDWSKNLGEMFDTMVAIADDIADGVGDLVVTVVEDVENIVSQEVETLWEEIFLPLFDFDQEDFSNFNDRPPYQNFDLGLTYHESATTEKNPACIGCVHYHGMVYNGNLLVCAMHPEGSQDNTCLDWEG